MNKLQIHSIKKQLVGFSIGPIISAVIGMLSVPLITWFLLPDELGKASMFTLVEQLFALFLCLGLDQSFVREFNVEERKGTLFATCITIPLLLSVFIGLIALVFSGPLSLLLFDEYKFSAIALLAVNFPFLIINRFCALLIRMKQNAFLYSIITILEKVLNFLFLLFFILFINKKFEVIIYASVLSVFIVAILQILILSGKRMFSGLAIDKALLKKVFHYGLPLIPTAILIWVFSSTDKWTLRIWSSYTALGIYASAFKIVTILKLLQNAFTTFWTPMAHKWYSEKADNSNFDKIREYVNGLMTIAYGLLIVTRKLIILFLGKAYYGAEQLLPFLLLVPILTITSETTVLGIYFSKKTKNSLIISIIVTLTNLSGNLLLVGKYDSLGVSISTGISYLVFLILRTVISRKLWYNFSVKRLIINTALIVALAALTLFDIFIIEIFVFTVMVLYNSGYFIRTMKIFLGIKNENNAFPADK